MTLRPLIAVVAAAVAAVLWAGVLHPEPLAASAGRGQRPGVGPEVPVTAIDRSRGPANNSPTIVADPSDPRFVVLANRLDAPDFGCALHVSGDGGRSWAPATPVPELPEGAEKCYAPEVAIDGAGKLYYLFIGLAGKGNEPMGAFLTSSSDRGRSFAVPRRVLGPLNFAVRMAVDPTMGTRGRIHLVWLHATSDPPFGGFGPPPNPILAAYSDDGGRSFSKPVRVSDPERQRVVAPALALGPDHRVHVAYYDLKDDALDYQGLEGPVWEEPWSLVVATSRDGGRRFSQAVAEPRVTPPRERVMLIFTMPPPALVARKGRMCLAWTDGRHGDHDVLARCTSEPAKAWETVRRLNDDKLANGHAQYLPRLSFGPDGRLDAVFYDRRNDPRNAGNDVYYTWSTDGGRRFAPNTKLTSEPSLSLIGQRYANVTSKGQVEFGGRLGLLSRQHEAVAAWADTRSSVVNSTGQDVFSTVIRLPGGGESRSPAPAVLVSLLAALVMGTAYAARWRLVTAARAARRHRVPVLAGASIAVVAVAVVAWPGSSPRPAMAYLPKAAPVVTVRMSEYSFDYDGEIPAGRVVFRFVNAGRHVHRPALLPLDEDLPPLDEQLRGAERRSAAPFAGVYNRSPGTTGSFAVDLLPGKRYGIICYARDEDGSSHALKGMNSEFRTRGGASSTTTGTP